MSTEGNKARTRRFMDEVFNKGNMKAVDELISTNIIEHNPFPDQAPGLEGFKKSMTELRQAFPDLHTSVDDLLADGDKVVIRSTMTGTHKGNFMNILATGKQIKVEGIDIVRIKDGKAVEHQHWGVTDMMTIINDLLLDKCSALKQSSRLVGSAFLLGYGRPVRGGLSSRLGPRSIGLHGISVMRESIALVTLLT